jgi:hypothetical protein
MNCDIILRWNATPEQLAALGAALWRWCSRVAENTGIYQYLDNQALADVLAGKLPRSRQLPWQAGRQGVHFWVRDEASDDRQATIESLRRALSGNGIEDIVVDGKSWNLIV